MAKSGAERLKEYRKRMKEQGFVRKEVWIKPDYIEALKIVESHFRWDGLDDLDVEKLSDELLLVISEG